MTTANQNPRPGISRRTVATGIAWSVPAVAIATASPAMAVSPGPGTVTLTGHSCKLPGNAAAPYTDGSVYTATISNTTAQSLDFEITSFTRGAATQPGANIAVVKLSSLPAGPCCVNLGNEFTVPANSSGTYAFVTQDWGSSGSGGLVVGYNVNNVTQTPATGGDGGNGPIPGNCGSGGSCSLTSAQEACIEAAIGVPGCSGNCS
ncbi:hypothetical protein [Aestuariimicrobium sp. Y1814]|uniref:hypothetical protein n=1 Tax=Aestuariimicrobium sp. Y1814 TaxID=3418742 RepID=UPI003DA71342